MKFEIEKYLNPQASYFLDQPRTMSDKAFEAELDHRHLARQSTRQVQGLVAIRDIEGDNNLSGRHGFEQ